MNKTKFASIESLAEALPAEYVAAARGLRQILGARLQGTRRERKQIRARAFARWERARQDAVMPTRAELRGERLLSGVQLRS
jgi:hypothetical protein